MYHTSLLYTFTPSPPLPPLPSSPFPFPPFPFPLLPSPSLPSPSLPSLPSSPFFPPLPPPSHHRQQWLWRILSVWYRWHDQTLLSGATRATSHCQVLRDSYCHSWKWVCTYSPCLIPKPVLESDKTFYSEHMRIEIKEVCCWAEEEREEGNRMGKEGRGMLLNWGGEGGRQQDGEG